MVWKYLVAYKGKPDDKCVTYCGILMYIKNVDCIDPRPISTQRVRAKKVDEPASYIETALYIFGSP